MGEWTPTRPRGPIGAQFAAPGPKYLLPGSTGFEQHDVRKRVMPAYTMAGRTVMKEYARSPGPIYKIAKYTTRHGLDGAPVYSCAKKIPPLKPFSNPGPGTYAPERSGPSASHRAPVYTLHDRTKLVKSDIGPGPAAYLLPSKLGDAPDYSLVARRSQKEYFRSPGPAVYNVTNPIIYKYRDPIYSVTGRTYPPLGKSCAPGPGQHHPEKYTETGNTKIRKSFGIRHSVYSGVSKFDTNDV